MQDKHLPTLSLTMEQLVILVILIIPLALISGAAKHSGELTPNLEDRVLALLPKENEEHWLTVPWQTNLATARQVSLNTGKPLLIWAESGHVLGCT